MRKILYVMMMALVLFASSQEALANGHGRGRDGDGYRDHREYIFKRSYDRHFYHYPRKKFYIFQGYYYYYPRKYCCSYDYSAYRSNRDYLPITVIADMAAKGVPDDVIIEEIKQTGSVYHLTSEVITYLKDNRVSDRVVDYMLQTAREGY